MADFSFSEFVDAAPRDVFYFLVAVENAGKMDPAIKGTEKLGKGPLDVGTRYVQTRQEGGKEIRETFEVVEFEAPYNYAVSYRQDHIELIYRYVLRPESEGTQIELLGQVRGEGMRKPLAWLVAKGLQREDRQLLKRFRRAFEKARAKAVETPQH
ncbi:MAG: hypothetical protein DWG76_02400 [Chloroflexi bacterium]|nr:hypothetical protein [Chloroflexota bacterium]